MDPDATPKRYRSPSVSSATTARHRGGADTPRDLNARVKLLELYTLHVLPRNGEWDYAREFVAASPVLDDERREAFLQALHGLEEEARECSRREEEERRRREEAIRRDVEEARRLRAENEARERRRLDEERTRREAEAAEEAEKSRGKREKEKEKGRAVGQVTEGDFGIDGAPIIAATPASKGGMRPPRAKRAGMAGGSGPAGGGGNAVTLMTRASMVLGNLRALVDEIAGAFRTNPYVLYRMLAFIIGLLVLLGRRRTRERVARVLALSWAKVKATAGMGTKVSYI